VSAPTDRELSRRASDALDRIANELLEARNLIAARGFAGGALAIRLDVYAGAAWTALWRAAGVARELAATDEGAAS